MKKIYTLLTALCLGSVAMAQDAFWTPTTYRGAFPVTDNTPATDWTSGWANFDPENTVYPATVTTVSADITTNTTWSGVVKLMNKVYVKNNATLTIAPGTIIRGDKLTQGTLLITRGAKIIADGTAANPIVFTSNEAVGARNEGDWGGLVLLGLAKNNQPGGVANIEGIVPTTDSQFGGNFDNDNSGTLRYVRIEFAGIALEPNKEINGITFGSVGSSTIVDYVQVAFSGDDSFEWFGGTVNCKHLIAYRGLDDDFDTDFGYRGKVQFFLSIRDKDMSDAAGDSNSFESDNDAAGSTAQPKTAPIFSNGTLVGPKGNGTTALPVGEKFEKAFRLRRNTATSVFNTLVTGWEKGLSIEGTPVVNNVNGDTLVFGHNSLSNFNPNTNTIYNAGTSGGAASTAAFYLSFMGPDGNDTTATLAQINWVNLFTALGVTPDARLAAGSVAASNGNFMNAKFYSVATPVVATNSFTYCQGATATALTATALSGNSLRWYTQPTGGTYTTTAPVPSTTTAGTYTYYVSQANANNDESMRAAITVVVNALPATPVITASGSTTFCTGGSVDLTSSASAGNVWSTNATTSTITVSTTGNYSVTVTDANGCSSASTPISVNVSNAPAPTISASSTQACSGDVVTVTASAADSYLWSSGETTQSIQVSATAAVFVTVTNANACNGVGQSATTNITFTATPTAAGSFTSAGNVVTFTNTSTGATAYSWDFGDFTNSSAMAPAHAYAANGTYTVVLTAINGNCTSTTSFEISIEVGMEEATALNFMVYPNPATEQVLVAFENNSAGTLNITDATGRLVYSAQITEVGSVLLPVNVSELAAGSYTVQLISDNQVGIKHLMIRK
jgi:PKD domain/Secretion system C-terminal sorting domain/Ig-like domain CHU_C associated